MKRKLIGQAGQAVTITLPIEWVRESGLKPGNEIELLETGRDLVLKSGTKKITGAIKLNLTGLHFRTKYRYINAAYARGIDEIQLEAEKAYYPDLNQTLGFAVVSQKGNTFTIRDISGQSYEDLDEILKRVFQMILNFSEAASAGIFGGAKETPESLDKKDAEINKFTLFLQRSIMKHSCPDFAQEKILFAYSYGLEKIGDEILRLWRTSLKSKIDKSNAVKDIVLASNAALQKAFEVYYQQSPEKVTEVAALREATREKAKKLFGKSTGTSEFVAHALNIAEEAVDLSHLALMKKLGNMQD